MSKESVDRKTLLKLGVGAAALVSVPSVEAARKPPTPPPVTPPTPPPTATLDLAAVEDLLAAGQFVGLPGYVNLHQRKYNTPTDGSTDALPAIQAAIADTPLGGTLQFGPFRYALSQPIDISDRTDIRLLAHGGSAAVDTLVGTYFVPTNADLGAMVVCAPTTISQHGPSIEGINVINEAGYSGIGGFQITNCNGYKIARCGVKYADIGFDFRYGEGGEDNAWQHIEDYWAYQCKIGFRCNQVLGMRAYSGRIDTVDGGFGMIWTGFAQNLFFYGLFIDGQNAGGVAKGTGIAVNDTGAHDVHVIGYKLEACGIGADLQNGTGPGTNYITFTDGEVGGVNEGTPSGIGFQLGPGVSNVEVRGTRIFNMAPENRWVDQNSPSSNRLLEMGPPPLPDNATAQAIVNWLHQSGLAPRA